MSLQPEHGTLAARVTVPRRREAQAPLRHLLELPRGRHLLGVPQQPGRADPGQADRRPGELVRDEWAGLARQRPRGADPMGRPQAATLAFRDGLFGSTLPPEVIDAASATLALLRTATVIRLEGGEIWAWEGQHIQDGSCEGSCTHVWNYQQALSHLFPALERTLRETEFAYNQLADRRPHLPPEAAARLGVRHDRAVRRRPFRRDHQDLSRLEALGRQRLAARLLAEHQARDRVRLEPGEPRPLGPGQDRRPLGPPAPDPRHGAVRSELLARDDVRRGADRRLRDGGGDGRRGFRRRGREMAAERCAPISTTSSSTAAGTCRRSTSPTDRCSSPSTPAARPACSPTASWRPTGRTSTARLKYQIGEGCIYRPDPRPVARRGRGHRRFPRRRTTCGPR